MTPAWLQTRYEQLAGILRARGMTDIPPLPVGDSWAAQAVVHDLVARVTGREALRITRGAPVVVRDVTHERAAEEEATLRVRQHPVREQPVPFHRRNGRA